MNTMKYSLLFILILLFSFPLSSKDKLLEEDFHKNYSISNILYYFDILSTTAITLFNENSDLDDYYQKSVEFLNNGNLDSALVYARLDSITEIVSPPKNLESSRSLILLSKIYSKLNNYETAINNLNKALELEKLKEKSDKKNLKSILFELSSLYIITSAYKDAENTLENLLDLHREEAFYDTIGYISALNNLAILSKQTANYPMAEKTFNNLITITKSKYGNKSNEYSRVLNNYASFCNSQEKTEEAESLYNEIISIDKINNNEFSKSHAITLNNLGSLYLQTGRFPESERLLKKAILIFEKNNDTKSYQYFSLIFNYARFQDYSGQYELAEKNYLKALNGFEKTIGNRSSQIFAVLNNLSKIYIKQNKIEEAEEMVKRTITNQLELYGNKHPSYSASLMNLSDIYRLKGEYAKSDSLLELCLEIENLRESTNQPTKAVILSKKGILSLDMAKFLQAEVFFRSALNINELNFPFPLPRMASDYANLGIALFHQNKKKEAKDFFIKSINTIQTLIKNYFPYCSEYEKAVYYDTLYSTIQKVYNYAIEIIKDYPDLLSAISSTILSHKAILFNYSQSLKNRVYRSNNISLINKFKLWEKKKNDYAKKYQSISINFKDINSLDSLMQDLNTLEKEIASIIGSSEKENVFNVDYYTISQNLQKNEAYVQMIRVKKFGKRTNPYNPGVTSLSFTDSSFYIALIVYPLSNERRKENTSANLIDFVVLDNGNDIDSLAPELFRNSIKLHFAKKIDIVQINVNQEFLYSILWEKIRDKLGNHKVVYFSPDGSYNSINLNTLINSRNRKYIIEEIDIRLISTYKEFLNRSIKNNGKKTYKTKNIAILFGDPLFYSDSANINKIASRYNNRDVPETSGEYLNFLILRYGLISLPGSRSEIQNISNIFKKKNWDVISYLGEKACEDSIKNIKAPKVLHIATHGIFLKDRDNRFPEYQDNIRFNNSQLLRSYLLFNNSDMIFYDTTINNSIEDGLLSAYEATNLNLNGTELVVLSACETGLGPIRNGEGIYGMQRAFQIAGAKSVMMSLWNVSDIATQELMTNFYFLWLLKGKSKHQAFREAQLQLKDKYPNFYFWGSFVLVGE